MRAINRNKAKVFAIGSMLLLFASVSIFALNTEHSPVKHIKYIKHIVLDCKTGKHIQQLNKILQHDTREADKHVVVVIRGKAAEKILTDPQETNFLKSIVKNSSNIKLHVCSHSIRKYHLNVSSDTSFLKIVPRGKTNIEQLKKEHYKYETINN